MIMNTKMDLRIEANSCLLARGGLQLLSHISAMLNADAARLLDISKVEE